MSTVSFEKNYEKKSNIAIADTKQEHEKCELFCEAFFDATVNEKKLNIGDYTRSTQSIINNYSSFKCFCFLEPKK